MILRQYRKVLFCLVLFLNGLLFVSPVWTDEYESAPLINAAAFLPGDLLYSVHHQVEGMDVNGGFYRFQVDSEFGYYQVISLALLRTRVHEIKTLAQAINQFDAEDDQFSGRLRSQLHVSGESAVDIITSPFGTASQLAGQLANNLGETLAGVNILAEKKGFRYEDVEPADAIAATHKRNIASQLGLDVYSTNNNVQAFLNTVTKARSSGRISAGVALVRKQQTPGVRIAGGQLDNIINSRLKSSSVSELNYINEQLLSGMRIDKDLRDRFLHHSRLSPRHQTVIATYLDYLDGVRNRAAIIKEALSSGDEAEALSYELLARMLALYHEQFDSLRKLHVSQGIAGAVMRTRKITYFIVVDILYWTEETENIYRTLAERAKSAGYKKWGLVLLGTTTPTARRNLTNMGFVLFENFLGTARG